MSPTSAMEGVPRAAREGSSAQGESADEAAPPRNTAGGVIVELLLFLCSYAPLFAMLAIRFRPWWLVGVCAGLALLGVLGGFAVLWRFRRVASMSWSLTAVEDRGAEVAGYVASYLLPFLTVSEPSARDLVAYGLFLVVVAVLYLRSGLVRINPTLYLAGWRLYAVTIGEAGWSGYVLSRRPLRGGEPLSGARLTQRLFLSY